MRKSIIIKSVLVCSDLLSLFISLILTRALLGLFDPVITNSVSLNNLGLAKLLGLLIIGIFWYKEQYTKRRPVWEELRQIYIIITIFAIVHFGVIYLVSHHVIKILNITFWLFLLIILPIIRYFAKVLMIKFGIWAKSVYIIGHGNYVYSVYSFLGGNDKKNILGYNVVGLVKFDNAHNISFDSNLNIPIYNYDDFLRLVDSDSSLVTEVEIICAFSAEELLKNINQIVMLQSKFNFVSIVPEMSGFPLYGVELNYFFGSEQLLLRLQNNLARRINRLLKRAVDILFSFFGLVLLFPIFLYFAIVIKLTTSGKVFFKHKRIGIDGKDFNCIKFQTMYSNSKELLLEHLLNNLSAKLEWEKSFKLKDDPRVTKIGKFLRKTSLDELPQLWNVLIGEMSLVGPRPIVEDEVSRYYEDFFYYKLVRPGITGLWQVSGRSDVNYMDRVRLDVWYVKNWSLWYDFVILLKTVFVVLNRKGAY